MAVDSASAIWSVDMDVPEAMGIHPGHGCNLGHPMAPAITKKRDAGAATPPTRISHPVTAGATLDARRP